MKSIGELLEEPRAAEQVGLLKPLIRQLRPHQWSKNALVLVPPLLAPGLPDPALLGRGLLAAFTFSLCASAGYVLNDLLDIEADRKHPTKRYRPFASGVLPPVLGPPLASGSSPPALCSRIFSFRRSSR
jgi:4-hydroxybenzoate polyprenyltransferase